LYASSLCCSVYLLNLPDFLVFYLVPFVQHADYSKHELNLVFIYHFVEVAKSEQTISREIAGTRNTSGG